MKNTAKVYLRESDRNIYVNVTGGDKPDLTDQILQKWQRMINTAANIFNVPAGLIMKITPEKMQVFLSSETEHNPYEELASDSLGHGLYCETVIGEDRTLAVSDSFSDEAWKDNPDVKINMISYLGMPLKWPDGEFFGTICVLDSKTRLYGEKYVDLLSEFRLLIESDLERELLLQELRESENLAELKFKEVHHRIKNQFNIISSLVQLRAREKNTNIEIVLAEVDAKLRSMALLHSKIYQSVGAQVSTEDYLRGVLNTSIKVNNTKVKVSVDFKTQLNIDNARLFDLGLVFSELAINSIKYGFAEFGGEISVIAEEIELDGQKAVSLKYRDNGSGFPDDVFYGSGNKGIGTLLIENFPLAFNGSLNMYNENGAVTEFILKI